MTDEENVPVNNSGNPVQPKLDSLTRLLSESWRIYRSNWKTFLRIILFGKLFYIPLVLGTVILFALMAFIAQPQDLKNFSNAVTQITLFIPGLFFIISTVLLESATVIAQYLFIASPSEYKSARSLYNRAFEYVLRFLYLSFCEGFTILGGLLLFVIPGLVFIVKYYFSHFFLLFENKQGFDAMHASSELVKKRFWQVVSRGFSWFLLILTFSFIPRFIDNIPAKIIYNLFNYFVVTPVSLILTYKLYLNLKETSISVSKSAVLKKSNPWLAVVFFIFALIFLAAVKLIYLSDFRLSGFWNRSGVFNDVYQVTLSPTPLVPTRIPVTRTKDPYLKLKWDRACSYEIEYDADYREYMDYGLLKRIFTDYNDPDNVVTVSCGQYITPPENGMIDQVEIDGQQGILYRDVELDNGTYTDIVNIKHPGKEIWISITGYGQFFIDKIHLYFIWG